MNATPMQADWVGDVTRRDPKFKDIPSTRDAIAERKAVLCLEIKRACAVVPDQLKGGGTINAVRQWKADREATLKISSDKRASVSQLEAALNQIKRHLA